MKSNCIYALFFVLVGCQTTNTGSNWIDVDPSNAAIQTVGLLQSGNVLSHRTRINSVAITERLEWRDESKRATLITYELSNNNQYFGSREELSRVATFKSLRLGAFNSLSAPMSFHNSVDLIEYGTLRSGSDYCLVYSMAYGIKSYVSSGHPVGNRKSVGAYCQSKPIDENTSKTFLSSFEIRNWSKYPEKTAPYLQSFYLKAKDDGNKNPIERFTLDQSLDLETRRFMGGWAAVADKFEGEIKLTKPLVHGQFSLQATTIEIKCIGSWNTLSKGDRKSKPSTGNIEAKCSNGESITGSFSTLNPGTGVVHGFDSNGREVKVSYN